MTSTAWAFEFEVNGFGSIVASRTISDEPLGSDTRSTYLVVSTIATNDDGTRNPDARIDNKWSFKPDSNLAFQFKAKSEFGLSATAQVTAQAANSLDPEFEWLYLSYAINDSLSFNAGRQRLPLYLHSDHLDVGYTYHWVRPPIDIYGGEGVSRYHGASLLYTTELANIETEIHLYAGNIKNDNSQQYRARIKDLYGAIITGTYDWLTLRAAYHIGENYTDNANEVTLNPQTISKEKPADLYFASFGFIADFNRYFFEGEIIRLGVEPYFENVTLNSIAPGIGSLSRIGDSLAYMLTGGYRFKTVTLHLTWSERQFYQSIPSIPQVANLTELERHSWSIGGRWDFHSNMAFKTELTVAKDGSPAITKKLFGHFLENTILSIGVDYIF